MIRDDLRKRQVSYKGRTGVHKTAREAIFRASKSAPFAIPIPDDAASKAVEDQVGDALDALVLILGSWISQRLSVDRISGSNNLLGSTVVVRPLRVGFRF
jgi:hypothetical protein